MTGLSREQVDRLYAELDLILVWQAPLGRPKALPLHTALVMVLFQLRHNLPEDVCAEVFGCATATVWRYQEQLEPLIDAILDESTARVTARARSGAVLVGGFIAPVGERDDATGLFSEKKHLSGRTCRSWPPSAAASSTSGIPVPEHATTARPSSTPASPPAGPTTTPPAVLA
jgi:hypothetical protein